MTSQRTHTLARFGRLTMPILLTTTILGLVTACSNSSSKSSDAATASTSGAPSSVADGTAATGPARTVAEIATTTEIPTTTIKIGAPDDDAAAAAMNTTPFVTITLPPQPVTQPPTTPVPRTVPDLNIDAAAAEKILSSIVVPSSMEPVDLGTADVRGNAAAVEVATTAMLKQSVRSASSRLFQRTDKTFAPVSLVLFNASLSGASLQAELVKGSGGTATTFVGMPAVEHTTGSATVIIVVDGSNAISVVKGGQAEELVAAVLAASKKPAPTPVS